MTNVTATSVTSGREENRSHFDRSLLLFREDMFLNMTNVTATDVRSRDE